MQENTKILHLEIPEKLHANLKAFSEQKNISMASIVRLAVTDWLQAYESKNTDKE